MRAERQLEDVEMVLWGVADPVAEAPSGAAAALAIVAFMSFVVGLGVAALLFL